jgi:hypothetical protein
MFCLSTVDGNPFQKCFAFPPSMETLFKNVLPFHRRWKSFSKIFCLSTVDGNPFQKCFAFPPSMETPFQKCFAFPPETAVGAIQTAALRIKLILP